MGTRAKEQLVKELLVVVQLQAIEHVEALLEVSGEEQVTGRGEERRGEERRGEERRGVEWSGEERRGEEGRG